MSRRTVLFLLAASALWGTAWIILPWLQPVATPCAGFALTMAFAGIVLLSLAWLGSRLAGTAEESAAVPARTTLTLSLTLLAAPTLLSVVASQGDVAGWPILLFSLQALGLGVVLGRWSPASAIAPGALFILTQQSLPMDGHRLPWILVLMVAVAVQGFGLVYARRVLPGHGGRALLRSAGHACLLAAAILAASSLWLEGPPRIAAFSSWTGQSLAGLLILALATTAAPYALLWQVLAARSVTPQQVAAGQWVQSFVASATAAISIHAMLGWQDWLAFLAIPWCVAVEWRAQPGEETNHGICLGTGPE